MVDRQEVVKEQFVRSMRMSEPLFGLSIFTCCVMGNHFHMLVEAPKKPEVLPTAADLEALIRRAKWNKEVASLEHWFEMWREYGDHAAIERARESYVSEMLDVPQVMKVLKHRFTRWFNGSRPVRRKGTLWSGYGEACADRRLEWKCLQREPVRLGTEEVKDAAKSGGILAWYRMQLVGRGQERNVASGKVVKTGSTQAELTATETWQG